LDRRRESFISDAMNAMGKTFFWLRDAISLTPGFSRVWKATKLVSRFNGLSAVEKPLKRFWFVQRVSTGLNPGGNEIFEFCPGTGSACFVKP
jgi:hypothetical protein